LQKNSLYGQEFLIVNAEATTNAGKKRQAERDSLFLTATMKVHGLAAPVTVRVRNLSNGGMMIDGNGMMMPGQAIETELRGIGPVTGVIAWVEAGRAGVAFDEQVDPKMARSQPAPIHPRILKIPLASPRRPGLKSDD
jgi:hypothetical protein